MNTIQLQLVDPKIVQVKKATLHLKQNQLQLLTQNQK